MNHTQAAPQSLIIGVFLVLTAFVVAVAPLPIMYRSLGIVIASYLAFGVAGLPYAFFAAIVAPPIGLISGDTDWLIMLPIMLSSNLLALLGLELSWRYPAILVSPILLIIPQLFVMQASKQQLFRVDLPWEVDSGTWIALHAGVATVGVLGAIIFHGWRKKARKYQTKI